MAFGDTSRLLIAAGDSTQLLNGGSGVDSALIGGYELSELLKYRLGGEGLGGGSAQFQKGVNIILIDNWGLHFASIRWLGIPFNS